MSSTERSNVGVCALCLETKELRLSHIAPKFSSDWIKKTSVTGFMRSYDEPNRRMQDGIKEYLLCQGCEHILNTTAEKEFAEKIFRPHLAGEAVIVDYDDFLKRFAVSLAFRTAAYNAYDTQAGAHYDKSLLRAIDEWRRFLLGEIANDSYEHHMLPLDYLQNSTSAVPEKMNDYMMRSMAYDILHAKGKNYLCVYTKLPGFIFLSMVMPKHDKEFKGTKIHLKGRISLNSRVKYTVPDWLGRYWSEQARIISSSSPSDEQISKMVKEVERIAADNPKRILDSHSLKSYQSVAMLRKKGLIESESADAEE